MQQELFNTMRAFDGMPATRYQGSKRRFLELIYEAANSCEFERCLDVFGGTGSVTHLFRFMDKQVLYNDILKANAANARALFANKPVLLSEKSLEHLFKKKSGKRYLKYIENNYEGIYYTHEENCELDIVCQNILDIESDLEKCEAYYCLFQAALSKRPYNLFHRANLDIRTRDVERSFGNKVTWERSFLVHMTKFLHELTCYRQRKSVYTPVVQRGDAFDVDPLGMDLVYIDTPYSKGKSASESNYFNFYHFLDAMIEYKSIPKKLKSSYKHKPIYEPGKSWFPSENIRKAFQVLFERFRESIILVSYRSDGHPTVEELITDLEHINKKVRIIISRKHNYALASRSKNTEEVVLITE